MRKKVEYYTGNKITPKVLHRINLIDLKRIKEGITKFTIGRVKTLKSLCKQHETNPDCEHIILGEDWYIVYTNISDDEIDIKDWVAIHNVENKFVQTIEMFNALKQLLIKHSNCNIYSTLRHSTSYQFYKKLLDEGYIDVGFDIIDFDDCTEELKQIKSKILSEYDSLYAYLEDENRERYESDSIEDYIYHDVSFNITNEFINKYKKAGR